MCECVRQRKQVFVLYLNCTFKKKSIWCYTYAASCLQKENISIVFNTIFLPTSSHHFLSSLLRLWYWSQMSLFNFSAIKKSNEKNCSPIPKGRAEQNTGWNSQRFFLFLWMKKDLLSGTQRSERERSVERRRRWSRKSSTFGAPKEYFRISARFEYF